MGVVFYKRTVASAPLNIEISQDAGSSWSNGPIFSYITDSGFGGVLIPSLQLRAIGTGTETLSFVKSGVNQANFFVQFGNFSSTSPIVGGGATVDLAINFSSPPGSFNGQQFYCTVTINTTGTDSPIVVNVTATYSGFTFP